MGEKTQRERQLYGVETLFLFKYSISKNQCYGDADRVEEAVLNWLLPSHGSVDGDGLVIGG